MKKCTRELASRIWKCKIRVFHIFFFPFVPTGHRHRCSRRWGCGSVRKWVSLPRSIRGWMILLSKPFPPICNIFSWQKESKFLFNQVRLPPEETTVPPVFAEATEVEVFSRASDREACGWWCAEIKMIKGEFLVVEYLGWEHSYTEIVAAERLRVKNTNPPVTATTFHKFEVLVPEELRGL